VSLSLRGKRPPETYPHTHCYILVAYIILEPTVRGLSGLHLPSLITPVFISVSYHPCHKLFLQCHHFPLCHSEVSMALPHSMLQTCATSNSISMTLNTFLSDQASRIQTIRSIYQLILLISELGSFGSPHPNIWTRLIFQYFTALYLQ